MKPNRFTIICLIITCAVSGAFATTVIQERQTKQVTRVKRPEYSPADWDGVYFENLFTDGLVGERPESLAQGATAISPAGPVAGSESQGSEGGFAWSKLIGRTTIEDEVKAIQKRLGSDITTPVKFKSDYAKVNQSFSILSLIFGIIREYDGEVRWMDAAASAQASFEKAAANSRVGTAQAYESCKRRGESLAELVRGGKFNGEEKPPEELDWGTVADRSPLMERLQEAMENLKKLTANKSEFTRDISVVNHESEIVAAIAATLTRENMTDADDSGYAEFASQMQKSAVATVTAVKNSDYDSAAKAVNLLGQSCDNCHAEWR